MSAHMLIAQVERDRAALAEKRLRESEAEVDFGGAHVRSGEGMSSYDGVGGRFRDRPVSATVSGAEVSQWRYAAP